MHAPRLMPHLDECRESLQCAGPACLAAKVQRACVPCMRRTSSGLRRTQYHSAMHILQDAGSSRILQNVRFEAMHARHHVPQIPTDPHAGSRACLAAWCRRPSSAERAAAVSRTGSCMRHRSSCTSTACPRHLSLEMLFHMHTSTLC